MVPGSSWAGGGPHCGGFRRRLGADHYSHRQCDQVERLSKRLPLVRTCAGHRGAACRSAIARPQPGEVPASAAAAVQQSRRDYQWHETIRTPVFWVMYAMFVMVGTGGLMATAQLAPIASDFKVANVPVSILGLTLPALTFALSLDRILNGLCRPFFG